MSVSAEALEIRREQEQEWASKRTREQAEIEGKIDRLTDLILMSRVRRDQRAVEELTRRRDQLASDLAVSRTNRTK